MKSLEGAEKLRRVRRIKAGAIVSDKVFARLAMAVPHPELNVCLGTLPGEFPCVLEQIGHGHLEEPGMPRRQQAGLDLPFDEAVLVRVSELHKGALCHRAQIDSLETQVCAGHPCKFEQVVDQLTHVLSGATNATQMFLTVSGESFARIFE